jgi:hypothetical protein
MFYWTKGKKDSTTHEAAILLTSEKRLFDH